MIEHWIVALRLDLRQNLRKFVRSIGLWEILRSQNLHIGLMKRSGSGDNNYSSECNKDFHICLEFVFVERVNSSRAHRTLMLIERSWSIFIQIIGWPVKICIKFLVCIDSSLPQINMLIAYLCIWFLLLLFGAAVADTRPGSIDAYVVRLTQWPSDLISANMTIILIWLNVNMNFCVFCLHLFYANAFDMDMDMENGRWYLRRLIYSIQVRMNIGFIFSIVSRITLKRGVHAYYHECRYRW